jgi:tetratricopeptide (TPR) repeat protein
MMERTDFINIVRASMIANRSDFARSAAADWLATWPQDIEFQLLLAKAEIDEAYDIHRDSNRAGVHKACFYLLQRVELGKEGIPSWIHSLDRSLEAMERGNHRRAISQALKALEADPDLALPTFITVKAYYSANKIAEALKWARSGHDRWPNCLYFKLLIARDLIDDGEVNQGVEQLHKIAGDDPAGYVVPGYLDPDNGFKNLWLEYLTGSLTRPIPAEVAALMGSNRIPHRSSAVEIPEYPEEDVPQVIMKLPEVDPMDTMELPVQSDEVETVETLVEVNHGTRKAQETP